MVLNRVESGNGIVVFDVETTGLSPLHGHRIIEVGAVRLDAGSVQSEFYSLIDCGGPLPKNAQRVNGITDDMLIGQPAPETVFPDFRSFIGNACLVAHNAKFDRMFLRHEFARLGWGLPNRVHCTLRLSRQRIPYLPNHRLETVFRYLGGIVDDLVRWHRALDDARMAAFVWKRLERRADTVQH